MTQSAPRIPLVFIAGFLGAGKTTFLRALLPQLNLLGVPAAVILNDFANAEVDASLLRPLNERVRTISGSCVCCGSEREFLDALAEIEIPDGGVLLVEVNGASDMQELIGTVAMSREAARFLAPLQVTLVDAVRWQRRGWHDEIEREQARTSTHWHLAHVSEAGAAYTRLMRTFIRRLAPQAAETTPERLAGELQDFARCGMASPPPGIIVTPLNQHHHRHERAFAAIQVPLPDLVRRQDLERLLDLLPDRVLRVKGWCQLDEAPQFLTSIQHVRPQSRTSFFPVLSAPTGRPVAVVVGVQLPVERIRARFAALPSAGQAPEFRHRVA